MLKCWWGDVPCSACGKVRARARPDKSGENTASSADVIPSGRVSTTGLRAVGVGDPNDNSSSIRFEASWGMSGTKAWKGLRGIIGEDVSVQNQ